MSKKKKAQKASGLSEMNKAIAAALGFTATDNAIFRKNLQKRRNYMRDLIIRDRIPSFFNVASSRTVEDLLRKIIHKKEVAHDEVMAIQNLMMEFWMEDKRGYSFTQEALSFVEESFRAEEMKGSVEEVLKWACAYPLFLEFPAGSTVEKAFCGCLKLPSKFVQAEQCESNIFFQFYLFLSNGDTSCVNFVLSDSAASKQFLDELDDFPLLYKSLLYLGYLFHKADPKEYVLIPQDKQNCKAYQVLPIPSPDWLPEFADSSAWMTMGLRTFFGFLDRDNMLSVFAKEQIEHAEYENLPYVMGCPEEISREHLLYLQRQAVMDWENYRVIYRFPSKTIEKAEARYKECSDFDCANLLQFMPANALVFELSDPDDVVLVHACRTSAGTHIGIAFSSFIEHDEMMQIFNSDEIFKHNDDSMFVRACCALVHLLTIFRDSSLSRPALSSSPSFPQSNPREENVLSSVPSDSLPRIGTPVAGMPAQIFDVSGSNVRRARAEMERIYGKKSPHLRRRHVHHYWVGKGIDRHLEARVLETIHVNCAGLDSIPTVLREVR